MLQEGRDARVLALGRTLGVRGLLVLVAEEMPTVDLAVTQAIGEIQYVLQRERERENGLADLELARLDALRNDDLVLAREQRDAAHLLEVHPDGIGRIAEQRAILLLLLLLGNVRYPVLFFFVLAVGAERAVLGAFDGDLAFAVAE